ncbi:MAG: hypothetical protein DI534_07805 [Leifsonia xyli]|nr:MAG: hypothetical protein DI534_07805 [Leifsonia xyli]
MTLLRRIPLLALAPVLAVVALLAWAFASPAGAGPDDDYHLVSSWCAGPTAATTCAPVEGKPGFHRIPAQLADISCFQRSASESAACQDRLFATGILDRTVVTDRGNFYGEYPPVYYAVMGLFTSYDVQTSALVMRGFTILLFVGILTALYLLLPVTRRPTLLIGWLVTTVPLGVFLLSVNNPSAWATIGVGTSWLALLGYFETRGSQRIALGALYALTMLMAAGSRGDAAMYAGFATALVLVYVFRRRREFFLASILPIVMGLVALFFLLRAGQIGSGIGGLSEVPTMPGGGVAGGSDDPSANLSGLGLFAYNALNAPFLWAGAFGEWGLGWLDTGMPPIVVLGALGSFLVAIFLGLRRAGARKLIIVGVTAFALWAIPVYVLQRGGQVVGESLQPRYLLPLVVLFGGLVALGTPLVRWARGQLILVAVALSVAQALALHTNLRRYLTGTGSGGFDLDDGIEWWWNGVPFSPMLVWIVGSLAFAGLTALVVTAIRPRNAAPQPREAPALA